MLKLLDCTLRDGGRVINCRFGRENARRIAFDLAEAGLDIIELGFIRDKINYDPDTTFFTATEQMRPLISKKEKRPLYVAFVDYGMFDVDFLTPCDETSISGIRFGFLKHQLADVIPEMRKVKEKGYKLFVQGVDSLNYSDREMLDLIEIANELQPYSFSIVDTYGAMYPEDLQRIFRFVDYNLDPNIYIDFHSHNNYQLSFALAQEILRCNTNNRNLIIDVTLDGIGKGAGNLCTELMVDYLNRKYCGAYNYDLILDTIDRYIFPLKNEHRWGYSISATMAGALKSHPNNAIYLTEKFSLATKDINNILNMVDPELRKRYDYSNLEKIYAEYIASKIDDTESLKQLKDEIADRSVLILLPGASINTYKDFLLNYASTTNAFVITVNFCWQLCPEAYAFFGNQRRYDANEKRMRGKKKILTSNVKPVDQTGIMIDYFSVIKNGNKYFDNSGIMILKLMLRLDLQDIAVAGFDGFSTESPNNYVNESFENARYLGSFKQANREIAELLNNFPSEFKKRIHFLTPSIFSDIFEK